MKSGNWVPISKCAVRFLPKDRPYTKAEALLSIMVNYDNGVGVTVSGLAKSWSWGREKVRTFLREIGVKLAESDNKFSPSSVRQVTIQVPDRFPTGSRQVKAIDSKSFKNVPDRLPPGSRQVPDMLSSTINDPNPKPEQKEKKICAASEHVVAVFSHWKSKMGHDKAQLGGKRKKAITGRIKEGYSAEDLCKAVDGCKVSPFHQGQNENYTVYDDIELICRNSSQVDKFIAIAEERGGNGQADNGRKQIGRNTHASRVAATDFRNCPGEQVPDF